MPLITALVGSNVAEVRMLAGTRPDGVVIAATGSGNTHPGLLDLARSWMQQGIQVVLTSRCPAGSVQPGYGFPGGSTTWWEAGAIFGGSLTAPKARVALSLALGAGLDRSDLAKAAERRT